MKNKLYFLIKSSLLKKVKNKWFVVANVLLFLGILAVFNISSIIQFFGGDFNEPLKIYVVDEMDSFDILKGNIEQMDHSYYGEDSTSYEVLLYDGDNIKEEVEGNSKTVAFIIQPDSVNVMDVTLLSDGYIDTIDYQLLSTAINNTKTYIASMTTDVDDATLNKIIGGVTINREILDESKKSEDENMSMVMTTVFPILILPFFMLTIFLVQMIGAEINDEKTTRGMEIIISNVSPKTHFASKVISGNLFVLLQGFLLIFYALCGFGIKNLLASKSLFTGLDGILGDTFQSVVESGFLSSLWYVVVLTFILMIFTFIAYSVVAGILASVTTSPEDFQQLQTPIMVVLMIGYYFSIMASTFKGAIFIRILSYVPFISAILSPTLLVLGQVGIVDVMIAIVIIVLFDYLLVHFGLRIYKEGILNYSSSKLWKKMFQALRRKDG